MHRVDAHCRFLIERHAWIRRRPAYDRICRSDFCGVMRDVLSRSESLLSRPGTDVAELRIHALVSLLVAGEQASGRRDGRLHLPVQATILSFHYMGRPAQGVEFPGRLECDHDPRRGTVGPVVRPPASY